MCFPWICMRIYQLKIKYEIRYLEKLLSHSTRQLKITLVNSRLLHKSQSHPRFYYIQGPHPQKLAHWIDQENLWGLLSIKFLVRFSEKSLWPVKLNKIRQNPEIRKRVVAYLWNYGNITFYIEDNSQVAELVRRKTHNRKVVGSKPPLVTMKLQANPACHP